MEKYLIPAGLLQSIVTSLVETEAHGLARVGRDSLLSSIKSLVDSQDAEEAKRLQKLKREALKAELKEELKKEIEVENVAAEG